MSITKPKKLTARILKEELDLLSMTSDSFLDKEIESSYFTTGGLEIADFFNFFIPGNLVCYGKNEIAYFNSLPADISKIIQEKIFLLCPSCIVTSAPKFSIPNDMFKLARRYKVPLFRTGRNYHQLVTALDFFLTKWFAPEKSIHGTMMEVFGTGVLLLGNSGLGKSECALELVKRGHRLISDDIVTIKKLEGGRLIARGNDLTRHHMEIRGIGIINIKSLFGIGAILEEKVIELVVKFEEYSKNKAYDRLGIDVDTFDMFGIFIPKNTIPVSEGKNLSILVETAALNHHLKKVGENTPQIFIDKIDKFFL
ncbi:HPr(Ser) kinase/phosphatase [bacterium]|nr:HPr(Ser) kinase/phosphatase [bacterium]